LWFAINNHTHTNTEIRIMLVSRRPWAAWALLSALWLGTVVGLPGGWQNYPVYQGDAEYNFTVDAIMFLRKNCSLSTDVDVIIYDDDSYAAVVDSARLIYMSLTIQNSSMPDDEDSDVQYLVDGKESYDLYAKISTQDTVGRLGNASASNGSLDGNYTFIALYDENEDEFSFCSKISASASGRRSLESTKPVKSKSAYAKPAVRYTTTPTITNDVWASVPSEWDWRDHMPSVINYGAAAAASVPLSQGSCGSCYTFGGVTAMAYRLNIVSNGSVNVVPSPQVVMSCTNGCDGGDFSMVYNIMKTGNVPADAAQSYTGVKDSSLCSASWPTSTSFQARNFTVADDPAFPSGDSQPFLKGVLGEKAMMYEVFKNGPGGIYVKVENQFQSYSGDGVLDDKTCTRGDDGVTCKYTSADTNHAAALVGWGTDNGKKYWLIQNSWGPGWGNNGFLKLARGYNALGVETDGVMVGAADVHLCASSGRVCLNGERCLGGFRLI